MKKYYITTEWLIYAEDDEMAKQKAKELVVATKYVGMVTKIERAEGLTTKMLFDFEANDEKN